MFGEIGSVMKLKIMQIDFHQAGFSETMFLYLHYIPISLEILIGINSIQPILRYIEQISSKIL